MCREGKEIEDKERKQKELKERLKEICAVRKMKRRKYGKKCRYSEM